MARELKTHIAADGSFPRSGHLWEKGYTLCGIALVHTKTAIPADATCLSCTRIYGKAHMIPHFDPRFNTFEYAPGQKLTGLHPASACEGRPCVIHSPSDHIMRDWPLHWRADRLIFERLCPHGIGHPDPDSLYYEEQQSGGDMEYVGVHGCDGCCSGGFPLSAPEAAPVLDTPRESPLVHLLPVLEFFRVQPGDLARLRQDLSDLRGHLFGILGGVLQGSD